MNKHLKDYDFIKNRVRILPYSFVKEYFILPLCENETEVTVAVSNGFNITALDELYLFFHKKIQTVFTDQKELEKAVETCYLRNDLIDNSSDKKEKKKKNTSLEDYDLLEQTSEKGAIHLLNVLITDAISKKASDIHFEPEEEGFSVRYRIDGVLSDKINLPLKHQSEILTRIKVLAKLDIAEKRLPQDGRIKLKMGEREIDFRVSTIPVAFGERIVLRILDRSHLLLGLDQLGMDSGILQKYKKMICRSEGIILVTGPTGSGKTTTLYSSLREINSDEINVMTIEDPVEFKLPTIAQIQVNPKIQLTFAAGLRHILRQDPDVIMIGEIRDKETAEIAIQAALTGHLVFSTLHTNDAPSALIRLIDMGVEPYLLTSSLIGVIAQRLVRKICDHCKVGYLPEEEKNDLLYKGEGCEHCSHSGYSGRVGIYEFMEISEKIKKQLMKSPDSEEIRRIALSEGMTDLFTSGKSRVFQGMTTMQEVLRVTQISSKE